MAKQVDTPFWKTLVAGGTAGVTEICIMYPLDVVKTRAQIAEGRLQGNMFTQLIDLVKQNGLKTYRGIIPPILTEAPKRAVKFAANAHYQKMFKNDRGEFIRFGQVYAGVCAGITEAFIVFAPELIKIRLQAKEYRGKYLGTMDCIQKIYKEEGAMAFTKGLEATLWRHAVWNGVYFGTIAGVRNSLPEAESSNGTLLRNFIAGSVAGTLATAFNTPPDVVKSRLQNQIVPPGQKPKYGWCIPALAKIAREEGPGALYKGFWPKVMRLGPGGGIMLVMFDFVMGLLRDY